MRTWLLLGLLGLVALGTGCATVTMTSEENLAMTRNHAELEMREIGDDWNMIWLNDRQNRLSRWHTR
jgi:hypothetical protein